MKMFSTSFLIRKMQIKASIRYHHITPEKLKLKSLTIPNLDNDVVQPELSYTTDGSAKHYNNFGKPLTASIKMEKCPVNDSAISLFGIYVTDM